MKIKINGYEYEFIRSTSVDSPYYIDWLIEYGKGGFPYWFALSMNTYLPEISAFSREELLQKRNEIVVASILVVYFVDSKLEELKHQINELKKQIGNKE